ncbi:MAG: SMC-Scp complex subunit ScpB [Nanoarchaeota archaeon]
MDLSKGTVEELDNARDIENLKKVEAALFISGKFLSGEELVALTDLNPILLNQCLNKIIEKYDEGSAIQIIKKSDMWKMDVRPEYIDIVNKLATGNNEFTKAEQETLAVIAHKQPVSQAKIIAMRGNKAYEHIRKFVDLGLVNSKRSGRTRELNLSEEFYNYFNLVKKEKNKINESDNANTPNDNQEE